MTTTTTTREMFAKSLLGFFATPVASQLRCEQKTVGHLNVRQVERFSVLLWLTSHQESSTSTATINSCSCKRTQREQASSSRIHLNKETGRAAASATSTGERGFLFSQSHSIASLTRRPGAGSRGANTIIVVHVFVVVIDLNSSSSLTLVALLLLSLCPLCASWLRNLPLGLAPFSFGSSISVVTSPSSSLFPIDYHDEDNQLLH